MTRTCTLEACGKPLVRNPGEREKRWLARDYCDRSCYLELRRVGVKPDGSHPLPVETKPCAHCLKEMSRRPDERSNRWLKRECCSPSCASRRKAGKARKSGKPSRFGAPPRRAPSDPGPGSKPCEGCSVVLERGDAPSWQWRRKRFCSPGCASRSRVRVEPTVVPSADRLPAAPVPSGPAVIWRPAGFSKIPNAWAGHRPAEPDAIEDAS